MSEARQHSVPAGDLVLTVLPPFFHANWLGAGVVRLSHLLRSNGVVPRVVRVLEDLEDVPETIRDTALAALALDLAPEERLARLANQDAWLDAIVASLLAGPETLFAFSTWRTNVDVTLEVARRIREARPQARFVLGGPEAIERGAQLRMPWIDAVVSGGGDDVIVPLAAAFLDGQLGRARRLAHTWVAEAHADDGGPLRETSTPSDPVDYTDLAPLVQADDAPRLPTVLNVGCVFDCGFCTNRLVYPEIGWGSIEAAVEEVARITQLWADTWPDPEQRPQLSIELADATLNGWPDQFDRFCLALRDRPLALQPRISGNIVFDRRMTTERWEHTADAGLTDLFFGLESASDRIRRAMRKPGSIDSVWDALMAAHDASDGRTHVGFGVIVGWPDESEAEYLQTVAFLERVTGLERLTPNANVSPLFRSLHAQNGPLMESLDGPEYGVLWRGSGPAGAPEVRCRRMMGMVERFHGVMRIDCPVPIDRLARWMMPDASQDFLARWAAVHFAEPEPEPPPAPEPKVPEPEPEVEPAPAPIDPRIGGNRLAALFALPGSRAAVSVEASPGASRVTVRHPDGTDLVTFVVRPRDDESPCYRRTHTLNVSLLGTDHRGSQLELADRLLDRVSQREERT